MDAAGSPPTETVVWLCLSVVCMYLFSMLFGKPAISSATHGINTQLINLC